jgi:pyruvate/2-oxoglutarate dehydrogenase complex dihydrolipoamide dehydrogenase (E3) component
MTSPAPPPATLPSPLDEHNQALLRNVRPPDWRNPEPTGRYNLVVVGAGTAGLISAAVASGLGARVALVERHLLGGDCLNVGCVPSKAVIRAARLRAEAGRAAALGLPVPPEAQLDFAAAMERMRRIRAGISHDDSAARYRDELGVDVFLGHAEFTGPDRLAVGDRTLRFSKAVIAAGARASEPEVPGLREAGYLTNETVFDLIERPRRLAVIGGGPIGCELAQSFRRLGSEVHLVNDTGHILNREDADAAEIVQRAFRREGIRLELDCAIERVGARGREKVLALRRADGSREELVVDEILVGAGRTPNVEGLGLERAGIRYDARRGVTVDDFLRTSNRRVFAAGDVCMDWKFTHAADAAAKLVVQNALFFGRKRVSSLVMPWCTYTDPEIAHVGLYERDAQARGIAIDTYRVPLERVNRAVVDGEDEGFLKVHVRRGRDEILGATLVSAHAGETISEITLAIVAGVGLGRLTSVIHPYPTQAEAIKAAAGAYTRTRLTPRARRLLQRFFAWRR